MANKIFGIFGMLLALTIANCQAGVLTYSYNPAVAYQVRAPAAAYAYSSPLSYYQQVVAQPVITKTISLPAAATYSLINTPNAVLTPTVKSLVPVAAAAETIVAPTAAAAAVVKSVVSPEALPLLRQTTYESAPQYDFSYGVHDAVTGDIKSQVEARNGGNVAGQYSVLDADGYKRTVTYTADDINGFNAVVQREPIITKLAAVGVAPPALPVTPVVAIAPPQHLQQQLQYLPQAGPPQEQHSSHDTNVVESPQPVNAQEPTPIEYPVEQPIYPQDQEFPPFHQLENPSGGSFAVGAENDDSDVIEARSAKVQKVQQAQNNKPAATN